MVAPCEGKWQVVYISPENLLSNLHRRDAEIKVYQDNPVAFIVNEVHNVRKWWVSLSSHIMLLEVHPISYSTGVMSSACSSNVLVRWEIVFLVIIMDIYTSTKFYVCVDWVWTHFCNHWQTTSATYYDVMYSQDSVSWEVLSLTVEVIDLFENAKLLNLTMLAANRSFKKQYLAPIRSLSETEQCVPLQWVTNGEGTLNELKTETANLKTNEVVTNSFCEVANSKEYLHRYIYIDLKKGNGQYNALPNWFALAPYCALNRTLRAGCNFTLAVT